MTGTLWALTRHASVQQLDHAKTRRHPREPCRWHFLIHEPVPDKHKHKRQTRSNLKLCFKREFTMIERHTVRVLILTESTKGRSPKVNHSRMHSRRQWLRKQIRALAPLRRRSTPKWKTVKQSREREKSTRTHTRRRPTKEVNVKHKNANVNHKRHKRQPQRAQTPTAHKGSERQPQKRKRQPQKAQTSTPAGANVNPKGQRKSAAR